MGVEKETINLIALKKVYGACKQPHPLNNLSSSGWCDGCLSFREAEFWTGGTDGMLWSNRVQESQQPVQLCPCYKSLSSKPVPSLAAHFFFIFAKDHFRNLLIELCWEINLL